MIVYIQWSLVTVHFPLVVWRYYGPRSLCRAVLAQGTLLRKHPSLRAVADTSPVLLTCICV